MHKGKGFHYKGCFCWPSSKLRNELEKRYFHRNRHPCILSILPTPLVQIKLQINAIFIFPIAATFWFHLWGEHMTWTHRRWNVCLQPSSDTFFYSKGTKDSLGFNKFTQCNWTMRNCGYLFPYWCWYCKQGSWCGEGLLAYTQIFSTWFLVRFWSLFCRHLISLQLFLLLWPHDKTFQIGECLLSLQTGQAARSHSRQVTDL